MQLWALDSGSLEGCLNMAFDEALLEWVRVQPTPTLIVRTYCWAQPTVSLGVNQKESDVPRLLAQAPATEPGWAVVRRPTGGRAIYHGEDVSFSWVTNAPELLKRSVSDSYCVLVQQMRMALLGLGVPLQLSDGGRGNAYTFSSACFDTRTPSDLLDTAGNKVAGCAQLRRENGILQHGAAFVAPFGITAQALTQALFAQVARCYGQTQVPGFMPDAAYEACLTDLLLGYKRASAGILAKAATTSGSHLVPTSL